MSETTQGLRQDAFAALDLVEDRLLAWRPQAGERAT